MLAPHAGSIAPFHRRRKKRDHVRRDRMASGFLAGRSSNTSCCSAPRSRTCSSVAFLPDGNRVVTGSQDRTIRIWDVPTGKEVQKLSNGDIVRSIAVSPNGDLIPENREFRGWNVQAWTLPRTDPFQVTLVGDAAAPHFTPIPQIPGGAVNKKREQFETTYLAPQVGLEIITHELTAERLRVNSSGAARLA